VTLEQSERELLEEKLRVAAARRGQAIEQLAAATEELRRLVVQAVAAGITEVAAARLAQVDRMTIRAWLGK
jgi:hypothetical protein